MISTRDSFDPQETFDNIWTYFWLLWLVRRCPADIQQAEIKDTPECPTSHGTAHSNAVSSGPKFSRGGGRNGLPWQANFTLGAFKFSVFPCRLIYKKHLFRIFICFIKSFNEYIYLAPTIFLLPGIQLRTSTPEGLVERVGGWCLMRWEGTVGSPALRLGWQLPVKNHSDQTAANGGEPALVGEVQTADKLCRNGRKKGRRAEGRRGRGDFRPRLMLCEKWSVVGSTKGREECSCSYLHVAEAVLLQTEGGWGLREGLPEEVTWSEIGMMRYSHYAKICGKNVPAEGTNFSRNLEWDPSHMLCLDGFSETQMSLSGSKSMTDGQMLQGEVRNPRQVVVYMSAMRWGFLCIWH